MTAQTTVDSGIPGVVLRPGDHVCAFYRGSKERDRLVAAFLSAGVVAGDKCVCVVDSASPDLVRALVEGSGRGPAAPGQLDVLPSTEAYLAGGRFEPDRMIAFWDAALRGAFSGGYRFARAVGEMTWALREAPGVERLVEYESDLNRFLPRYPQVILCLYDLNRFGGELVVNLMKTHPKLLIGGMLLENPYYLEPDEFLAGIRG